VKIIVRLLIAALMLTAASASSFAQEYPKPTGYVNDFAGLLSQDQKQKLEGELADFDAKTTNELAVVTVPSLQGYSVESYAKGLATTWGIGKKNKDNGILFLIAPKEHKARIEPAEGVVSVLTDSVARDIMNNDILPQFKTANLNAGIVGGAHAIMSRFQEKAVVAPASPVAAEYHSRTFLSVTLVFVVIVIVVFTGLFISEKVKYKRGNLSLLKRQRTKLDLVSAAHPETGRILEVLRTNHPSTNWEDVKKNFDAIDIGSMESEYSALVTLCNGKWSQMPEVRDRLYALAKRTDGAYAALEHVCGRLKQVGAALAGSELLLRSLPALIASTRTAAQDEDVLPEIRPALEAASAQFDEAKSEAAQQPLNTINWLDVQAKLKAVSTAMTKAQKDVEDNKKLAIKAREEGPELLKKLPQLLAAAEKKVGDSDRRKAAFQTATAKYNEAQAAANNGNLVNWLIVYLLVNDAISSANAASGADHSYSSTRNDDWSSTSSTPSPGPSFTDFGGGAGFGGGVTGSW